MLRFLYASANYSLGQENDLINSAWNSTTYVSYYLSAHLKRRRWIHNIGALRSPNCSSWFWISYLISLWNEGSRLLFFHVFHPSSHKFSLPRLLISCKIFPSSLILWLILHLLHLLSFIPPPRLLIFTTFTPSEYAPISLTHSNNMTKLFWIHIWVLYHFEFFEKDAAQCVPGATDYGVRTHEG